MKKLKLTKKAIEYIRKNPNLGLFWIEISIDYKLSEDFIIEFQDKIDWYYISQYQKLSDKFIRQNISKLNKEKLLFNDYVSNELKQTIKLLL